MKRIISAILLLSVGFVTPSLYPARNFKKDYTNFSKGIAYVLLEDEPLALNHLNAFFKQYKDPALRSVFEGLIKDNSFEVTRRFKRYLDINHRSKAALVGIALSTRDMKLSTSIGNLERARRLGLDEKDWTFSSVYLCLGEEYMRQKNYPKAESYFNQALQRTSLPEYKAVLSRLYALRGEWARVVRLLKTEADRTPDNFYFNFYTAGAYYKLGRLDDMRKYIETAAEVRPGNQEAQLLLATYYLGKNDPKRALPILRKIKFDEYNEDYYIAFAHVLLKLNDRKTRNYLDEVYSRNRWNKDVNRLMGLYHAGNKRGGGNVSNWILRSILSGNSIAELKRLFPRKYEFPEYSYLPFFQVENMRWVSDDLLVVGAIKKSGESGQLFFIRPGDLKLIRSFGYKGELQDIFTSGDGTKILFSTIAEKGKSVYLYAVDISGRSFRFGQLHSKPLPLPSVTAGFNKAGNLVYITDRLIEKLAFESPFSVVPQIGDRIPVYESYPFPMYMYNFVTGRFDMIRDMSGLAVVPIPSIKKYYAVSEASGLKSSIQDLIQKGQLLDLTSSKIVKIYFSNDLTSFITYLSDLKNAFQATIYESFTNRILYIDETMFLGEGEYAEVDLLNFDPGNKEILLVTKDENRMLIHFNYKTYIYIHPASKVCEYHYDSELNQVYALTERSKKRNFTETNLEIISFKPYYRKVVDSRRDLEKILLNIGENGVYFSTLNGEWLMMDGEYDFHYIGPCFEGCLHALSPDRQKTAAYINGRLYVVDGPVKGQHGLDILKRAAAKANAGSK